MLEESFRGLELHTVDVEDLRSHHSLLRGSETEKRAPSSASVPSPVPLAQSGYEALEGEQSCHNQEHR